MAEYIEREKLGADFELCNKQNPRWTPQRVASLIARAPAADVVEVVRCRDCFYNANGSCTRSEVYDDMRYRPDYFCADGYPKDGDI